LIKSRKTSLEVLIVLTLGFIWGNSLMSASASGAFSDWVGNLLAKILGETLETETGHGVLRKVAHGTEYMILGVELWLLFRGLEKRAWSLPPLLGGLTALLDETIQLFVEGRCGAVKDVWIDMWGFTVGCLLCMGLLRLHRQRISKGQGAPE
jgi:VanZ family protein